MSSEKRFGLFSKLVFFKGVRFKLAEVLVVRDSI